MGRGSPEERPGRIFLSKVFDLAADFRWVEEEEEKERKFSPNQRFVIVTLFKFMGGKDHCWPTQEKLSYLTGLCIRQIKTVLKELVRLGVIERDRRQAGRGHEYRFTKAFIQSTKGATHAPIKGATCAPSKVQSMHLHGATCAPSRCNPCTLKGPEKQTSSEREGSPIRNKSMNRSSNQSGKKDGLTDEKEKPASEEVNLLEREEEVLCLDTESKNFSPPSGAPPRLSAEQMKAIFGGRGPQPVSLLECSKGDIDLGTLVYPFRINRKAEDKILGIIDFNPDALKPSWFELALKIFAEKVFAAHWNWQSKPPGVPFRRRFFRAGRSGVLYEFGFRPLDPEQQEERRRELEHQKEEAAEAARIEEEERRRQAKKDAALRKWIKRPTVRGYLDFKGVPRKLEVVRDHLREIAARLNGPATLTAMEEFMREELQNEGY